MNHHSRNSSCFLHRYYAYDRLRRRRSAAEGYNGSLSAFVVSVAFFQLSPGPSYISSYSNRVKPNTFPSHQSKDLSSLALAAFPNLPNFSLANLLPLPLPQLPSLLLVSFSLLGHLALGFTHGLGGPIDPIDLTELIIESLAGLSVENSSTRPLATFSSPLPNPPPFTLVVPCSSTLQIRGIRTPTTDDVFSLPIHFSSKNSMASRGALVPEFADSSASFLAFCYAVFAFSNADRKVSISN
ncbi:hypothetical protein AC579_1177 [Pseudocercospora musae]|uniref:Uncharacterized protein n=1 Tax=Pseudocercospora musae TaxID=113226 RepID=A0A139HVP6_9PEZI|nr:hypothetical protein AC579_1177 [Pseudocercospora musae]